MMAPAILTVPGRIYKAVQRHLLPRRHRTEEAAFIYAVPTDMETFEYLDWFPVAAGGFASRSAYHLELSDETRGAVIKRAHDLGASLVELHSHLGPWPAQFSPSDLTGFGEFVPHVWWRLKGHPYLAVVVARTGFDAFAWIADPTTPERLAGIRVGDDLLIPSGLSPLSIDAYDE